MILRHHIGPHVRIELDNNPEYLTNGDIIGGKLVVESTKSFGVQNIEIKLRCEEFAYVLVSNGQTSYYEKETVRYLSICNTLFPDRSIRRRADADPNARYTLQAGQHEFPFQFQIPLSGDYPESVSVKDSNNSGIRWYLKAVVHRGMVLAQTKRDYREFEMRPTRMLNYNDTRMNTEGVEEHVLVYLPGYSALLKTTSGKLKDIWRGNSHLTKKVSVQLYVTYPEGGLLQQPNPINILVHVECPDSNLLTIKSVEIQLKQKIVVSVSNGLNTAIHRGYFPLLALKNLHMDLKRGLEYLYNTLLETTLKDRVPGSMRNQHFDVSYKLVINMTFGSKEKPSASETIRLSVPMHVNGFIPRSSDVPASLFEPLPIYQIEPRMGEYILSSPVPVYDPQQI